MTYSSTLSSSSDSAASSWSHRPIATSARRQEDSKIPRRSLLIVDDEPDVLSSLRGMFRRDCQVHVATTAHAALATLASEPIGVVLCDQRMPGMSGADFLAEVSSRFPEVVRLMMTGYVEIESVIDAVNRGHISRYIQKPWDPLELEAIVRQAFEQFELLADRRRLMRALEEANQIKSAFIAVASHELFTPLSVALGMVRLARAKSLEPAILEYLERAERAGQRMQSLLVNTFKLLQKDEFDRSLQFATIVVADLFQQIANEMAPYLTTRRMTLLHSADPPGLVFHASPTHLADALINLVTNAIKFSPDGESIRLSANVDEEHVHFLVRDQGIGIATEDQPHIFEPFFGTWDTMRHSSGDHGYCKRGMGLGLAIAKRFVEMQGGELRFESSVGEGTTFEMRFPLEGIGSPP